MWCCKGVHESCVFACLTNIVPGPRVRSLAGYGTAWHMHLLTGRGRALYEWGLGACTLHLARAQ